MKNSSVVQQCIATAGMTFDDQIAACVEDIKVWEFCVGDMRHKH